MLRLFLLFLIFVKFACAQELTFCSWNLQNFFLKQPVAPNGSSLSTVTIKSEEEIQAIIETLKKIDSDIIGVSELGHQGEISFLQKELNKAGLNYPYIASTKGSDLYRSIGLLSKHPITQQLTPEKLTFHSGKSTQSVRRGFLSTIIATPIGEIHFVGCHLKSKRPMRDDNEQNVRYGEALRLREHLLRVMKADIKKKLVVYGDFNDTRSSAVIRLIGGKIGTETRLTKLPLKSSDYTYWTHHWKSEDVYSRFDYIFLSESLKNRYVKEKSHIASNTLWYKTSDHRPLFLTLK